MSSHSRGAGSGPAANDAERFEDEKRRIIDSCFCKKDDDGALVETYVTHIRITETASHPTSPPPPEARNPQSEKARIIIIAFRRSGRVRVHKSKENPNGSFSIGKTWDLNDLTAIESFTAPTVPDNYRQWAGETGFLVTLGKSYYWQAQVDKEKKFFLASLVKIYGKYTGGKVPELKGFDQKELDLVLGAGRRGGPGGAPPPRPPGSSGSGMPPPRGPGSSGSATPQQRPPGSSGSAAPPLRPQGSSGPMPMRPPGSSGSSAPPLQPQSFDPARSRMGASPTPPGSTSTLNVADVPPRTHQRAPLARPPGPQNGSPAGSFDSTGSREPPLRRIASDNRSQESFATARSGDAGSVPPPRSRNGMTGPGALGRFGDSREKLEPPASGPPRTPLPPTPQAGGVSSASARTPPPQEPPPERKRPPMDPTRPLDTNLVPQPLMSPVKASGQGSEPAAPPPRNVERPSPRKEGSTSSRTFFEASSPKNSMEQSRGPPRMGSLEGKKPDAEPYTSAPQRKTPSPAPTPAQAAAIPSPAPLARVDTPPAAFVEEPGPAEPASQPRPEPNTEPTSPKSAESAPAPGEAKSPAEEEPTSPMSAMLRAKKSKGDLAGVLWKAATAASAFKPRAGGAGDRLRKAAQKASESDGPDGITGVVPAPPRPSTPVTPTAEPEAKKEDAPAPSPAPASAMSQRDVPEIKTPHPDTSGPSSSRGLPKPIGVDAPSAKEAAKKDETEKNKAETEPRRKLVTGNDVKYLSSLGISPAVLDDRSESFTHWLNYLGWVPGEQMRTRNLDDMNIDMDREINKALAGGWLARFEEEDERMDAIKLGIDSSIAECEELDNLLTLYSVELSTLSDDIAYIEAQGQGLQVQTSNQKLLKKELESLLETCAITEQDLEALRLAPMDHLRGLEDLERSLVTLFKAMIKIDPSLGGGDAAVGLQRALDSDQPAGLSSDFGNMRIVREKKEMYIQESNIFMRRLIDFMERQFDASFAETKRSLGAVTSRKADPMHYDAGRSLLWKYSPMMLYARDVDLDGWNRLIQIYQDKGHPFYRPEFQTVVALWRKNARKLTGEEAELLFSTQAEQKQEGAVTTARKLTVKRSQTLARALRSPLSDGSARANAEKPGVEGRSLPYEVFAGVLDDLLPLVAMEQNFIIDFFHASTLEQHDLADLIAARKPAERRGGDLKKNRLMEPDRDLARRVTRSMEVIFSFLEQELVRLMEWVIGQDPLQGVGVLAIIEKKTSEMGQSNLDYLKTVFQKLHDNLEVRFTKFVEEQIRAIEETKVKINKRKGVISFIRIFPGFSAAVENMILGLDPNLPLRRTLDREYDKILKSMFDSLMVIARENPAAGAVNPTSSDPEDKEALNFHILLIENMNHFLEEVDTRGLDILEKWKDQANTEYHNHMSLYVAAVVRRPLGKLLDYLENIEAQLHAGFPATSIATQPYNSTSHFNKVLQNYDSKEVKKGIEALRKRIEKHFGDADEPQLSAGLVGKVVRECEAFYGQVEGRIGRVTTDVYGGDVLFEWPRADVKAAFR